jgi:hypothetical protein
MGVGGYFNVRRDDVLRGKSPYAFTQEFYREEGGRRCRDGSYFWYLKPTFAPNSK